MSRFSAAVLMAAIVSLASLALPADGDDRSNPFDEDAQANVRLGLRPGDSPQWGRSGRRNNVAPGDRVPRAFNVATGENIKWSAKLGSETYGSPVIANGKVFTGSNNGNGYLQRFPAKVDLGVLLCFDAATGRFLWQHSNEKRVVREECRRVGCAGSACVEGQRLWYVNNRNEVVCLDTEGFLDGENDGPFRDEPNQNADEADIVWKLDMAAAFGAAEENQTCSSLTAAGDVLFVSTANGVHPKCREDLDLDKDLSHHDTACFVALDKHTGAVLFPPRANDSRTKPHEFF